MHHGGSCFPGGSEVKASAWNAGDLSSIPGSGRSPGEGKGNPLQYSCLENPMDGGAWWATVHGVTKSRTRLSDLTHTQGTFYQFVFFKTRCWFINGKEQALRKWHVTIIQLLTFFYMKLVPVLSCTQRLMDCFLRACWYSGCSVSSLKNCRYFIVLTY